MVVFSRHSDHYEGSHREEKDCKDMFRDFFSLKKSETATSAGGALFGVSLIGVPQWAITYQQGNEKK